MSRSPALALLTSLCLGGGCAHEAFAPSEKATAISREGHRAAEYDLRSPKGELGEVKVWSGGAEGMEILGKKRTVVHVAFEVENTTDGVVSLDPDSLWLESVAVDGELIDDIEVTLVEGITKIPSAQAARVDAYFAMPRGVDALAIEAFRVRWSLRDETRVYTQWTPFTDVFTAYAYGPGFYNPMLWGPPYSGAFPPPLFSAYYPYRHR